MTSVTNSSGLNFQNGVNPLGRKVRALEADVDTLKKELAALKAGGAKQATPQATPQTVEVSSSFATELDILKRELAMIRAAGYGKGEKGDKGDKGEKGDKGDKGDQGPMTYIAMPPQMMPAQQTTTA